MTIVIFTGPTLSPKEAKLELEALYLPPASQGDVYRASLKQPDCIGIIDGYFNQVPAVWHKEILWAMSQGIHVFGSASMGALRAAEMTQFGMVGVGKIFEAYRDGTIEDDDEVALVHGSAETGYRALSEPMVNIRFTLAAAEAAGVLNPNTHNTIAEIAKELFYPERLYPLILQRASEHGLPVQEISALQAWLPQGQINQKREDAIAMLKTIAANFSDNPGPKTTPFLFEYTEAWDQLRTSAGQLQVDEDSGADTFFIEIVLEELRLDRHAYRKAYQKAIFRSLALSKAHEQSIEIDENTLHDYIITFRRKHNLLTAEQLKTWMEDHHLNRQQFLQLMEEEAQCHWLEARIADAIGSDLLNSLRLSGLYQPLVARALDKQRVLESHGLQRPNLKDFGLTHQDLHHWCLENGLGDSAIEDAAQYARSVGFANEASLYQALLREFCYRTLGRAD